MLLSPCCCTQAERQGQEQGPGQRQWQWHLQWQGQGQCLRWMNLNVPFCPSSSPCLRPCCCQHRLWSLLLCLPVSSPEA